MSAVRIIDLDERSVQMTSSQNPEPLNGTFCQVDPPDRRVSGALTLGDQPALGTLQLMSGQSWRSGPPVE